MNLLFSPTWASKHAAVQQPRAGIKRRFMTHAPFPPSRLPHRHHVLGALCAALLATLSSASHAADAGKCPEAIEKLTRAEALHHAPTILGRLGECQVNVVEVVTSTENLNTVVRE